MIKFTYLRILLVSINGLAIYSGVSQAADYNVYGKAEVQIANTNTAIMRYTEQGTQIEAPFSRLGIKGQHRLNQDLDVVFKYEVQVKGFEEDDTDEPFAARNTYLGLKGTFGEIVVGKNDTRFKYSEGKVDNFNETQADIAQVIAGQDRLGDTLTYTSKYWYNGQFSFTYAPKDDNKGNEAGFAATLIYGDRNLNNTPYYLSVSRVDSLNNINASRIAAVYKFEQLQVGALYQHAESTDGIKSGNGYVLSASYALDKWIPKIQFVKDDSTLRQASDATQWSTGVDYVFDKQTTAYLLYTDLDLKDNADNSVALGLKYKF